MTAQFWMVLDSQVGSTCSKRHETPELAELEAERLAIKEQRPFYVLEAVDICRPAPQVIWEDLERPQ